MADNGVAGRFVFPRPMTDRPGLDFSFSGLKTFAANTIKDIQKQGELNPQDKADIACAFQTAVVETLAIKCKRALMETGFKRLVIAGGVGANRALRESLQALMKKRGGQVYYPRLEFCTDNGAMIAYAGAKRLEDGQVGDTSEQVLPRWSLDDLPALTG